MHCMLLGYSFKPSPNSLAFGTSDPFMTIGLSISNARTRKTSSTRENMADWSKFELRRPQRLGAIQAGPPFLLLNEEEDKRKLCSHGELQVVLQSGGSRGVARGGGGRSSPPLFWTKMRPEGGKIFGGETAPPTYLRVWMTGPSLSQGVDPALL